MTTPKKNGHDADASQTGARKTRPELERTDPNRNIFNAFRQSDGREAQAAQANRASFEDNDVWGAASRAAPGVETGVGAGGGVEHAHRVVLRRGG